MTRGSVLASTELSGLRCVTAGGGQLTAPLLLDLFYWRDAAAGAILDLRFTSQYDDVDSIMNPLSRNEYR